MPDELFLRPDVLVLAAGGPVGEAWMTGVLAGIEEATGVDFQMSVNNVLSMIRGAGFTPAQRDTTYAILREYGPDEWES